MDPVVNLKSLKRSHELDTEFSKCVFCQNGKKNTGLTTISYDRLQRVKTVVADRIKYSDDSEILKRLSVLDLNESFTGNIINEHKSYYAAFTTVTYIHRLKRKYEKETSHSSASTLTKSTELESQPPRPVSRSLIQKFNSNLCIFCQKVQKEKKDRRKEMKLHDVSSKEVSAEILETAKSDYVVRYHLSGYINLIAPNAQYHNPCQKKKKKKSRSLQDGALLRVVSGVVSEIRGEYV